MMRPVLLLSMACIGIAVPAAAQTPEAASIERVVAYIDAAHFDSARISLARWQTEHAATARPSDRATADVLRARLERAGPAARDAWLSVALAHPFGADAGLALLRVGQAAVLQGDTSTALVYLTRLLDDFPGSGHSAEAQLWLSRLHSVARRSTLACSAARDGLASATSAEVVGLLRIQEQRACAPGAPDDGAVAAAPPRPTTPAPPAGQPAAATAAGRYAVQSGAFRARAGADALMARLRQAGLQPRLVRVAGSDLMRVRVGSFPAPSSAVSLRDELRADGFDAVVVDDANREAAVP